MSPEVRAKHPPNKRGSIFDGCRYLLRIIAGYDQDISGIKFYRTHRWSERVHSFCKHANDGKLAGTPQRVQVPVLRLFMPVDSKIRNASQVIPIVLVSSTH